MGLDLLESLYWIVSWKEIRGLRGWWTSGSIPSLHSIVDSLSWNKRQVEYGERVRGYLSSVLSYIDFPLPLPF